MRKIILYTAASIDNFIANVNGGIEWLHSPDFIIQGEDYGYANFYHSIDTTIIGNKTFQQIMGFDTAFPYPDKMNYILTHHSPNTDSVNIKFIDSDLMEFIEKLKGSAGKDIWLVGGGRVNTLLLDHNLIDEIILTRIPVGLGDGIPIFYDHNWEKKFGLIKTTSYGKGVMQFHYEATY